MTRTNFFLWTFLFACAGAIGTGIGMSLHTGNAAWLLLCAPIVMFLS